MVRVPERTIRALGLVVVIFYAGAIVWLFAQQPRTFVEAVGGFSATIGTYDIDRQAFADGLRFFRNDRFVEARAAFERADPAVRNAVTQFYIAYSYYRQGWHRLYRDDDLYKRGLETVDRAIALAPEGRLVVDDQNLDMKSADELRAELHAGMTRDASDFNPLRLLRERR